MSNYKKQLELINQSIKDTEYIKINDNQITCNGVFSFFKLWTILFFIHNLLFYIIDKTNFYFELYDSVPLYFPIYNSSKIIINIIIPLILYMRISKMNIPLKERRFLKTCYIFPVLLCFENTLPSISAMLNSELLISFYQSFPVSSIIMCVCLAYTYSYFKDKKIIYIGIMCLFYYISSFCFLSIYMIMTTVNHLVDEILLIINFLMTYKIIELLAFTLVILLIKRTYLKRE